jgi:iron(III) transport system ATP-binding protein
MFVMMKDINFKYNNSDSQLLNGFSLNIPEDKITCILGASGSGKSTILRLISGLEKPKKGFIKYKGQVIVGQNTFIPPEKRGVGMVFQDYALFPHMNLAENILFGVKETGRKKKKKLNQFFNPSIIF